MSHFTVLVVGDNVEEQLEPFNENLETEWVDETESFRKQYEEESVNEFYCASHSSWGCEITKELFDKIKSNPVGSIHHYERNKDTGMDYLEEGKSYKGYYKLENGKRCEEDAWFRVDRVIETTHPNRNVCFEGKVSIKVIEPPKEISFKDKYPDYETYLKDWHGIKDVTKQGYWTNKDSKWDWYEIGGRWTGFFKLKKGTMEFAVGRPGLMTKSAKPGYADQCRKKDIDFDGMRDEAGAEAEWRYDTVVKFFGGSIPKLTHKWSEIIDENGEFKEMSIDQKRELYHNQAPIKELKDRNEEIHNLPEKEKNLLVWLDLENYLCTKEEYIASARAKAISTFAILKDGKWYERGKMGWFGMTSDENLDWNKEFNKLLDSLPEDTLLTVVDCHI